MACLYDLDGDVVPCELSNASVRNFPSDATLNAEAGVAKSARGGSGSARTSSSPSSRRERGGDVLAGGEGEGWTGAVSRAGGAAAQPPQARGRSVARLRVGWKGRCLDRLHCMFGRGADLGMTMAQFSMSVGGAWPLRRRRCMTLTRAVSSRPVFVAYLCLCCCVLFVCSGGCEVQLPIWCRCSCGIRARWMRM